MPGNAAPSRAVFAWALLVAGALSVAPTRAGNLQVAPISLEIAAQEQAQTLTLGNTGDRPLRAQRSEEHTSELQSLMRISYAVFCLKKKTTNNNNRHIITV